MTHKVVLRNSGSYKVLQVDDGTNLLKCIQEHFPNFFAPCGGNGTCGKCRVHITEEGHVTSCLYSISKDIDAVLPEPVEMKVLSSQYKLTKVVRQSPILIPELMSVPYGLAVDIGTTTIVIYLVNLLFGSVVDIISTVNPQSKYGADVISRINYSATQKDGISSLQKVLVQSINDAIDQFATNQMISREDFVKISIVGNTTMLHNILGVDALPIAHAPFTPPFTDTKKVKAGSLGIHIHQQGEVVLGPSLSGYVGADIIAGLASIDSSTLGENYLYVDIGTNGEMVLVTPTGMYACATAAGPAFEGANISCGMSALPGAIAEYNEHEIKVIGNIEPTGICGSGLIDIVAFMLDQSKINPDGNISSDIIVTENRQEKNIVLNQQDIREVQLAKSAIASGINRMIEKAGLSLDDLSHVLLAGGFGNYLNVKSAIRIGLLPEIAIEKYIQVGNSAGSGAVLALKSDDFITEMEELKKKIEYIELSTDEEFTIDFAMNMNFLSN